MKDIIHKSDVRWGQTFKDVSGSECHTEPKAFCSGTSEEGATSEALWIDGVGEIEITDITDMFYVIDK